MREVLESLALANLAAAAAVVLVLTLRLPARRWFGARIAYGLWSLVPLTALATLLPARTVTVEVAPALPVEAPSAMTVALAVATAPPAVDLPGLVAGLWLAGALASLAWLAWKQAEFARAARDGLAGPAVLGVLRPRIVTPGDFARRYTPREQAVVLAHEAAHIARHDSRINALVALARCLNWFNPLVHVAAHYLRLDQELACDACVVAAHPQARRSYAEAMLKAQLASRPLPLGCYWPASGVHPLAERVSLLARTGPNRWRRRLGVTAVALLGSAAVGSAWAAKPAQVLFVERAAASPTLPRAPVAATRLAGEPTAPTVPQTPAAGAPAPEAEPTPDPAMARAEALSDSASTPASPAEARPPVAANNERKIFAAAHRSRIEPGSAVRLVATMVDPDGRFLLTDLTAFGSQRGYRTGWFTREGSRSVLFTSVVQDGDTLWVTASSNSRFRGPGVGTIAMKSGETRDLVMGDGQVVTVTPTLRPETVEEQNAWRDALRRAEAQAKALETWRTLRDRCRTCRGKPLPDGVVTL